MKKVLFSKAISMIIVISFFLQSCFLFGPNIEYNYPSNVNFSAVDESIIVQSRNDGNIIIKSESLDTSFELTLKDENGDAIDGYLIWYEELHGEAIISGYDPYERYSSIYYRGDPNEIADLLTSNGENSKELVTLGIIVAVIVIGLVSYKTYEHIKIDNEITTYVHNSIDMMYNGEVVLKTTVHDFVQYYIFNKIKGIQTDATILLSIASLGIASAVLTVKEVVIEIVKMASTEIIMAAYTEMELAVLESLTEIWSTDNINANSTIYVIMPFSTDAVFHEHFSFNYSIFLEDPSTYSVSGWWDIESEIQNSTNSSFPVGYIFENEAFLRFNYKGEIEVYEFTSVGSPNIEWETGILSEIDSYFKGSLNGCSNTGLNVYEIEYSYGYFNSLNNSGTVNFNHDIYYNNELYLQCDGQSMLSKSE